MLRGTPGNVTKHGRQGTSYRDNIVAVRNTKDRKSARMLVTMPVILINRNWHILCVA